MPRTSGVTTKSPLQPDAKFDALVAGILEEVVDEDCFERFTKLPDEYAKAIIQVASRNSHKVTEQVRGLLVAWGWFENGLPIKLTSRSQRAIDMIDQRLEILLDLRGQS